MTDLLRLLEPLRTAGLSDIVLAGRIDNDGPAPMFRPSGTDVYLTTEGETRMLRLEQIGEGIRLSRVTDYVVPAGLSEDEEFGVSLLKSPLMERYTDPSLVRVRHAPGAGSDPTVLRWIEFAFVGGLQVTAGPVSSRGIALAVGPGYSEWGGGCPSPALPDLVGARLQDVVVPGFVERDQEVAELVAFPTIIYLMFDRGVVEAEQVLGGGGVQFRSVTEVAAPVQLIDSGEEVGYVSLAPLLPDDTVVTRTRFATDPDDDLDQGIVRAAEFQLGDALRLVLDPMTLLGLELSVRRPEPAGESQTITVTRA